jgi:hypothetical protein
MELFLFILFISSTSPFRDISKYLLRQLLSKMSYNNPRGSVASHIPPSLAHVEGIDQLTASQVRLLEKQQEYHGLQELRRASATMLERMEELARMSSVMADGGAAIGSVLRNWPHVFSILSLFREFGCPDIELVSIR